MKEPTLTDQKLNELIDFRNEAIADTTLKHKHRNRFEVATLKALQELKEFRDKFKVKNMKRWKPNIRTDLDNAKGGDAK